MKKLVILTLCCTLSCTNNNSDPQTPDSSIAKEDTQTQDSGSLPNDAADTAPDESSAEVDSGTTKTDIEACPALSESNEHKVLFDHRVNSVYSPNGVSFANESTLLLEHASVPDGVLRADGKTWVYYINGNPGQHAIFVAELNADGSALEPVDCIRIDGKVVGDAVDPDIVLLPDGRYRLFYYLGWFVTKPTDPNAPHPFYSAISEDGIHFQQEGLLLETEDGGTDPSAAQLSDGSWLMSVTVKDNVLLAASQDGMHFELTDHQFPQGISELHYFGDNTVRLYISGQGLAIWKSEDNGVNWAQEANVPVPGHDPSLIKNSDGSYTLFTKTVDNSGNMAPEDAPLQLSGLTAIDDDGVWTPGETLTIAVTLTNQGDKSYSGVGARIDTKDPVVTLEEPEAFVDTLAPGESTELMLTVRANDGTPTPYKLPFLVAVSAKGCSGPPSPECPPPYQINFTANIGVEPIISLENNGPKPPKP